jgi:hypothetical protein
MDLLQMECKNKKQMQSNITIIILVWLLYGLVLSQSGFSQSINTIVVHELYAPKHFGNSYEVMGELEMRDLLTEAVYWGFNRYGDWVRCVIYWPARARLFPGLKAGISIIGA